MSAVSVKQNGKMEKILLYQCKIKVKNSFTNLAIKQLDIFGCESSTASSVHS